MDRKKELKEQYKQMKTKMGIFVVRCMANNKYYLRATQNLNGIMNSTKFQLNCGSFPNEELQSDWKNYGSEQFQTEILEELEYDKDEAKTDYSEELDIMKMVWNEKLSKQNLMHYEGKMV